MRRILIAALAPLALSLAACQEQTGSVMDEIQKSEAADRQEREAAAAAAGAYLADNAKKPGVLVTATGLQIEIVRASADQKLPMPGPTSEVTVHYEGTQVDGTVFDSSYARGEPATFPLDGVIPGWTEGLQLMRPGDEARLAIPAELAYGDGGPAPGQPLLFRVELLSFRDASGKVIAAPK